MGSADVSCPALEELLRTPGMVVAGAVTQPDRPSGRRQHCQPCPGKAHAVEWGVPVITPERVNHPETLAQITAWAPDVVVVVAYGQLLGRALLALPRLGCVNLHLSLLPRHRGAAPIQWSIAEGDVESGVTVMQMDAGMDTGDILSQQAEPIHGDDTAASLGRRLAALGAGLLARTLVELAAGRTTRRPQDSAAATLAPKLSKQAGHLDWSLPAAVLERRVRAFHPWPACFTVVPVQRGTRIVPVRLKVLRAEVFPDATKAAAGTVLAAGPDGLLVASGAAALRLVEVQPEGGTRMDGRAFLLGHPVAPGTRLTGAGAVPEP